MLRQLRVPTVFNVHRNLARRLIFNGLVQKKSGLFGFESLQTSSDFKRASENAMKTIDYIKLLLNTRDFNPKQTLLLLDSISNELCRVIDVAELCRNVHTSEEFQVGAEESFASLSSYIHKLNSDRNVYLKLVDLMNNQSVWQQLSDEEKLFVIDLRGEFEADGIHLEGQQKEKGLTLQGCVVASETEYSQNVAGNESEILIGPFPTGANIQHLKQWLGNYVTQRTFRNSQAYLICNGDRRLNDALLRSIDQEYVRRHLYGATLVEPTVNISTFGALVKDRQALAKCLGYESFAHKILKNKVLKTPENVLSLLKSVNEASKQRALSELAAFAKLKQTLPPSYSKEICEKPSSGQNNGGLFGKLFGDKSGIPPLSVESGSGDVHPWDIQYLGGMLESLSEENDSGHGEALVKVQEFLHVDTCLDGLKHVTQSLFGITIQECEMDENERWTVSDMSSNASDDESNRARKDQVDIKKYVVLDEDCEVLGTVYLDLFMRPTKFSGSAHFSVRCGCTTLDTSALHEVLSRGGELQPPSEGAEVKVDEVKQLPCIAIVINFKNESGLLSLYNLETLYHEWGHALHSLLSKTQFQHLSGTRGGADFVEVPSHLFEFFARSPEIIQTWARHYKTGEEIPLDLLHGALKKNGCMAGLEVQHQLLLSAMDQFIFGPSLGDVSSLSPEEVFFKALSDLVAVQKEFTVLPTAKIPVQVMKDCGPHLMAHLKAGPDGMVELPALHLLNHTHFINYGGCYYSYLFAKMYAAQIWAKKFAADPLSRASGQLLYKNMLIYGSGKEPAELLRTIGEGPLDPTYYFKYVLQDNNEAK